VTVQTQNTMVFPTGGNSVKQNSSDAQMIRQSFVPTMGSARTILHPSCALAFVRVHFEVPTVSLTMDMFQRVSWSAKMRESVHVESKHTRPPSTMISLPVTMASFSTVPAKMDFTD
jgi:hypothetical protein